jgi:hypothetical protein
VSEALDPRDAESNSFQDALLGLAALCRELDALVARLPPSDGTEAEAEADTETENATATATATGPDLIHCLLGLVSLRKMFGMTLDALLPGDGHAGAPDGRTAAAASDWNREHLR